MDITSQVDTIVANLVRDIETRLNSRVDNLVKKVLEERLDAVDYDSKLNWLASAKLDNMISDLEVDSSGIQKRVDAVADAMVNNIEAEARKVTMEYVRTRLHNEVDVNKLVRDVIVDELTKKLKSFTFPERSIPGNALNPQGLVLTGNNIVGGVIKNFNSVGIEDRSSDIQMTLLDEGVVIENKVITLGLEVKGATVIDGDLHINGDIPADSRFYQTLLKHSVTATRESLGTELFQGYSHVIFELIKEKGLDLDKLLVNGQTIIEGTKLNYGIVDTNIQRLGMVKDFQTTGESLLSQTLYVTKNRVGVNTMDPGHAFSVWDQEVEIGFAKKQKNTAWIGTPRAQDMVLSANDKENIVLRQDGSTAIHKLELGGLEIGSESRTPEHVAPKGSIVFNSDPVPGGAFGWVSLGNGTWSRIGNIG